MAGNYKLNYTGRSMNPTLRVGDVLIVIPYEGSKMRTGDVVLFCRPRSDYKVAHRVISVDLQGIRTQGDNNDIVDSCPLRPDNVLGRVVYAQRGNRRLRIYGGPIGRVFAAGVRTIRTVKSVRAVCIVKYGLLSLLRPPYNRLVQSGIFRECLATWMETRVLSLDRPAGVELQLLVGRRVIGRRPPGKTQWQIRRPFRLFVDETSLP